jgi:hypothetical protein
MKNRRTWVGRKCHERSLHDSFAKRASFTCIAFAVLQTGGAHLAGVHASQPWPEIGLLDCVVGPNAGLVAGRQFARCTFHSKTRDKGKSYFAHLSQVGRSPGLPSGGRLVWVIRAPEIERVLDISGRYEVADGDGKDSYTLCRTSPPRTCLTPAQAVAGRRSNLAPVVLEMSLDTTPFRKRAPGKDN